MGCGPSKDDRKAFEKSVTRPVSNISTVSLPTTNGTSTNGNNNSTVPSSSSSAPPSPTKNGQDSPTRRPISSNFAVQNNPLSDPNKRRSHSKLDLLDGNGNGAEQDKLKPKLTKSGVCYYVDRYIVVGAIIVLFKGVIQNYFLNY